MNQQQAPVYFGTITQSPSDPYPSQYGGADRMISVEIGEYGVQKIWFKDGGIFDQLAPGDVAIVEYRSNKWRFSKQQTPELTALLKGRGGKEEMQLPPTTAPSNVVQMPNSNNDSEAVQLMISIFSRLRREIPQASDEAVAKLACTVFNQLMGK